MQKSGRPSHHHPTEGGHVSRGCWAAEKCRSKQCNGLRVTVGFIVSDEDWKAVCGDDEADLCLSCFDEEAEEKRVKYTLLALHPLTWHNAPKTRHHSDLLDARAALAAVLPFARGRTDFAGLSKEQKQKYHEAIRLAQAQLPKVGT